MDEALDSLLALSLSQEVCVEEELVLASDRSSVQPDTFATLTDGSLDGNGDLDWTNEEVEEEELSVSFREVWDGSVTPMTEASWMDELATPSSCPGTPESSLEALLLQTPTLERVSAPGHVGLCPPARISLGVCACVCVLTVDLSINERQEPIRLWRHLIG